MYQHKQVDKQVSTRHSFHNVDKNLVLTPLLLLLLLLCFFVLFLMMKKNNNATCLIQQKKQKKSKAKKAKTRQKKKMTQSGGRRRKTQRRRRCRRGGASAWEWVSSKVGNGWQQFNDTLRVNSGQNMAAQQSNAIVSKSNPNIQEAKYIGPALKSGVSNVVTNYKGLWRKQEKPLNKMTRSKLIAELRKFRDAWEKVTLRNQDLDDERLKVESNASLRQLLKFYYSDDGKEMAEKNLLFLMEHELACESVYLIQENEIRHHDAKEKENKQDNGINIWIYFKQDEICHWLKYFFDFLANIIGLKNRQTFLNKFRLEHFYCIFFYKFFYMFCFFFSLVN